ncbi:hypothetical protein [Lancefieldella parvula]|uniref:hypothetical protein n=1 Tax=Lancefieldella parvula TaxID=1382 RepID=UPI0028807CFC|nr:hypothetical protein [Lancefieldella parvula]
MPELVMVGGIWRYLGIILHPLESRVDSGLIQMRRHNMDQTSPHGISWKHMDKMRHRVGVRSNRDSFSSYSFKVTPRLRCEEFFI